MRRENLSNQVAHKVTTVGAADASAISHSGIIDLGPRHNFREICGIKRGAASVGETLLIWQSHNGDATTPAWALAPKADLSAVNASPASGTAMVASAAPGARWIRLTHTNGATAQTALELELSAYPS